MQEQRRQKGSADLVRTLDAKIIGIAGDELRFRSELRDVSEHIVPLIEANEGSHTNALEFGIADRDLCETRAQGADDGIDMRRGGDRAADGGTFLSRLDRHFLRDFLHEQIELGGAGLCIGRENCSVERIAFSDEPDGLSCDDRMALEFLRGFCGAGE